MGRVSREARLCFLLLFTIADDSGRARASSRLLASLLYPYDEDAGHLIDGWLDELEGQQTIRRYSVDGDCYLEIVKWLKHQKIDRPSLSRLPQFDEGSRGLDVSSTYPRRISDADLGPRISTRSKGYQEVSEGRRLLAKGPNHTNGKVEHEEAPY